MRDRFQIYSVRWASGGAAVYAAAIGISVIVLAAVGMRVVGLTPQRVVGECAVEAIRVIETGDLQKLWAIRRRGGHPLLIQRVDRLGHELSGRIVGQGADTR